MSNLQTRRFSKDERTVLILNSAKKYCDEKQILPGTLRHKDAASIFEETYNYACSRETVKKYFPTIGGLHEAIAAHKIVPDGIYRPNDSQ